MDFTIEELREEFEKRKKELKDLDKTLEITKGIIEYNNDEKLKQGAESLEKYREDLIDIIENLKTVCKENFIEKTNKKENITETEIQEYSRISKEIETLKNKYGKFMSNENKTKIKNLELKQKQLEQQIAAKFPDLNGKITEAVLKDVQEKNPEKEEAKKLIDEINEILPMTEEELHKALFEGEDAIKAELPGNKKETLTAEEVEEMDEILNSVIMPQTSLKKENRKQSIFSQRKINIDMDKIKKRVIEDENQVQLNPAPKKPQPLPEEVIAEMDNILESMKEEPVQQKEENIVPEQNETVKPRIPKKIPKLHPQPQEQQRPIAPPRLTQEQRLLREMIEADEIDKKVKRRVPKEKHDGKVKRLMQNIKGFFVEEIEEEIGENENDRGKSL